MADAYVVDTGVFLRWFVDQDGFEHARELQQEVADGSTRAGRIPGIPIITPGVPEDLGVKVVPQYCQGTKIFLQLEWGAG